MQLDLVDLLRCPAPHDEMPLVCVARSTTGRELRDATLGCPTCHAEFPVRDGVAWLGLAASGPVPAPDAPAPAEAHDVAVEPIALAAMLGLAAPGGTVALAGSWAFAAPALAVLVEVSIVVLGADGATLPAPVSVIAGAAGVPLARGALRALALALEPAHPGALEGRLAPAGRVVQHGGRLVAPVACALPPSFHELARDDAWWVAEHRVESPAGSLRRAPRPAAPS